MIAGSWEWTVTSGAACYVWSKAADGYPRRADVPLICNKDTRRGQAGGCKFDVGRWLARLRGREGYEFAASAIPFLKYPHRRAGMLSRVQHCQSRSSPKFACTLRFLGLDSLKANFATDPQLCRLRVVKGSRFCRSMLLRWVTLYHLWQKSLQLADRHCPKWRS